MVNIEHAEPIAEQVINFFAKHFERIFGGPFRHAISEILRCKAVLRQVDESADAASQSLTRLLVNEQLDNGQAACLLQSLEPAVAMLDLASVANPNISPEALVTELLQDHPPPASLPEVQQALMRVALHSIVQVLTLVGPVMAEWQKLGFSDNFELPRKIVERLNRISEQMNAHGQANSAADERYELLYRDYLQQRFHRVEAGTVKMTTNLNVDLRELFVMPKVFPREIEAKAMMDTAELMDLGAARLHIGIRRYKYQGATEPKPDSKIQQATISGLDQIRQVERNVLIGVPGGGKSTFFEWLQIQVADANEELVMNGKQAIPLLLRIRQLDIQNLPDGAEMIAKATASEDRAKLMPPGWVERQMQAGRVLFMLDGLDETDPGLRDTYVLPWLADLCKRYPGCRFLVSSRPSGYPPGTLHDLGFTECDLLDFGKAEIAEYTCHWCTAVRLARNEPSQEARDKGQKDGALIVKGFRENAYVRNLARNPLMLSAICLINYFEGGQLPRDRALLYRLCVEGLLHHWDQRRGIHSEFGLEEKLRACRELALAMQADDRAEYTDERVRAVFAQALSDAEKADKLLEHIRHRAGLLVERRPGVFSFAHLTFQEYLAAQAIHEGNRLGLDMRYLVREHNDPRWQEVIALYCRLSTDAAALSIIQDLMIQPNKRDTGLVLFDAYRAASGRLNNDNALRIKVLERIMLSIRGLRLFSMPCFTQSEISTMANRCLGKLDCPEALSAAHYWLLENPDELDIEMQLIKLDQWRIYKEAPLSELLYQLHRFAPIDVLTKLSHKEGLYLSLGPKFSHNEYYECQAEIAIIALSERKDANLSIMEDLLPPIFYALSQFGPPFCRFVTLCIQRLFEDESFGTLPHKFKVDTNELLCHARKILIRFPPEDEHEAKTTFLSWINALEKAASNQKPRTKSKKKRR